jgi:hypothetical protein
VRAPSSTADTPPRTSERAYVTGEEADDLTSAASATHVGAEVGEDTAEQAVKPSRPPPAAGSTNERIWARSRRPAAHADRGARKEPRHGNGRL